MQSFVAASSRNEKPAGVDSAAAVLRDLSKKHSLLLEMNLLQLQNPPYQGSPL